MWGAVSALMEYNIKLFIGVQYDSKGFTIVFKACISRKGPNRFTKARLG